MKNLKRIISMMLVMIMALAMCATVSAEEPQGAISITNVSLNDNGKPEATYAIYKMLDLVTYSGSNYSYKVTDSDWKAFFETDEAKAYMTVDAEGYATYTGSKEPAAVAEFARAAVKYAKDNNLTPDKTTANSGDYTLDGSVVKFTGLELGYYLIDSSIGALCGLTTTDPSVEVEVKNKKPTIEKKVFDEDTREGDEWSSSNTAGIGETVQFRTEITVYEGAQDFVLHDKMGEGLTFVGVTEIYHHKADTSTGASHTLTAKGEAEEGEEGEEGEEEAYDYEVITTGLTDGCTFHVIFSDEVCKKQKDNDRLIVLYEAILNENAIIADGVNANESQLEYGDNHFTTKSPTETKTFAIDLVKVNSGNNILNGASFKIYTSATETTPIKFIDVSAEGKGYDYRVATAKEIEDGAAYVEEIEVGKVRICGFDSGTYYLEEIEFPEGYNPLTTRQAFNISNDNRFATLVSGSTDKISAGSGVAVVNNTGTILPTTGGIGTTLFYVIGGILVAAAVVLLVAKKRMEA